MSRRYQHFVEDNFKKSSKMTRDLARLLDEPLFAVDPKNDSCGVPQQRERAYNRLCRMCLDVGVALPDLEPELIDCYLPHNTSESDVAASNAIANSIRQRVDRWEDTEANICRAVATMFDKFPGVNGYGNIDKKALIALANRCLLQLELEPIRPDYKPIVTNQPEPPRKIKVLIVDDEADKILETAIALAGWPIVEIKWLHHNKEKSKLGWDPSQEKIDAAVTDLAKAIVDSQPDIVLMDQGIDGKLEGHLVVGKIRESVRSIVFVANTGGTEDELLKAGCVAGAKKGEKITEAMRIAFDYLS